MLGRFHTVRGIRFASLALLAGCQVMPVAFELAEKRSLGAVSDTEPAHLDALWPRATDLPPLPASWEARSEGGWTLRVALDRADTRELVVHQLPHQDGGGPCVVVHGALDHAPMPSLGVVRTSLDGRWLAAPLQEREGWRVVLCERDEFGYREIARTRGIWAYIDWPAIAPDAERVAFWAFDGAGSSVVVVEPRGADLVEIERFGSGTTKHWPSYAKNGRLAFRSIDEGRTCERVTVDRVAHRDYVRVGIPRFSPEGSHVVYGARRDRHEFAVVDGVEWGPFDQVGTPWFEREDRVLFVARQGKLAFLILLHAVHGGS